MVRGDAIIHKKPLGLDRLCVRRKCPVTNSLGRNAERVKGMSNERTRQTAGIKFLFSLISATSGFSKAKIKFLASDASRKPSWCIAKPSLKPTRKKEYQPFRIYGCWQGKALRVGTWQEGLFPSVFALGTKITLTGFLRAFEFVT